MTVSITASRGSNHKRRTFVQRLRWIPDHDDGATFTPGSWQQDGGPEEIAPGASATGCFTDDDGGLAFHVYQEPLGVEAEAEAEAAPVGEAADEGA